MKLLFLAFLMALIASAQAPQHSVTLLWADASNPTGTTYSVYRATGLCSGSPVFVKLGAGGLTVKTYLDLGVVAGIAYCYQITASLSGSESGPSSAVGALVPTTFPPTGLTITVF
jgi:hypothetical protein